MKGLITGKGEIGTSLYNVLKDTHETYMIGREINESLQDIEVLNICFPYQDNFVKQVQAYMGVYNPQLVIIHSTVAPGTTRKCGYNVVHSPIHGKHPNLEEGIKTFVKYIGGADPQMVGLAASYLQSCGVRCYVTQSPEASELSKILCTSYYGWNILFNKEVKKICDEFNVDLDEVYTQWNELYNEGYTQLGMGQFNRPILQYKEGGIGGHCVVPNCNLLDSFITNTIKEKNKEYEHNL